MKLKIIKMEKQLFSAAEPRTLNNQNEQQLVFAAELGQSIIDRAEWWEETGEKRPFLIADIKTLLYHVQLNYIGRCGDYMTFSLVDLCDPYSGGTHGYPKVYNGNTGAFFMEIVRELEYIRSVHHDNA